VDADLAVAAAELGEDVGMGGEADGVRAVCPTALARVEQVRHEESPGRGRVLLRADRDPCLEHDVAALRPAQRACGEVDPDLVVDVLDLDVCRPHPTGAAVGALGQEHLQELALLAHDEERAPEAKGAGAAELPHACAGSRRVEHGDRVGVGSGDRRERAGPYGWVFVSR
jgi:hypothetical protein